MTKQNPGPTKTLPKHERFNPADPEMQTKRQQRLLRQRNGTSQRPGQQPAKYKKASPQ